MSSAPYSINTQANFVQELEGMISQFKLYQVPSNQAAALAEIPSDFLLSVAQAKYESSMNKDLAIDEQAVVRDMFLFELMSWFKNDFFSWMDSPNCPNCSKSTTAIGNATPSPEELAKSAGRVEIFTCRHCFKDNRQVARFPRYNHPTVLLKTRQGRCGEWANCFALICKAAGFEVRHVHDKTDHVWLEIFSNSLKPNRWVHVDPCENSYDSPLLYDKGWGKKLSYVIAVSQDDVQDVTWRYIQEKNLSEVLARRKLIGEAELVQVILRIRNRLQQGLPESRKELLKSRLAQELAEFLYPRASREMKESEEIGRGSGSQAWRLARQEIGAGSVEISSGCGFVWKASAESKYVLTYNCAKDMYFVLENGLQKTKSGWKQGTFHADNISRKVERDWKMAYLAREEMSKNSQGSISWQFSVQSEFQISSVTISAEIEIFNTSASISLKLADENGTVYKLFDSNKAKGLIKWSSDDTFQKCRTLTLQCILQGGEGNTGWQHAQLFRQALDSDFHTFSVELKIVKT